MDHWVVQTVSTFIFQCFNSSLRTFWLLGFDIRSMIGYKFGNLAHLVMNISGFSSMGFGFLNLQNLPISVVIFKDFFVQVYLLRICPNHTSLSYSGPTFWDLGIFSPAASDFAYFTFRILEVLVVPKSREFSGFGLEKWFISIMKWRPADFEDFELLPFGMGPPDLHVMHLWYFAAHVRVLYIKNTIHSFRPAISGQWKSFKYMWLAVLL